jgi:putative acyl-CoA dehydrogenase
MIHERVCATDGAAAPEPAYAAAIDQGPRGPVRATTNQSTPLQPRNLYATDVALQAAVVAQGGGWGHDQLTRLGACAGSTEAHEHGLRAERNEPQLVTHDRFGHRIDEVQLDPSWFWLRDQAVRHDVHALAWRQPQAGAHVVRAASVMLWNNTNAGVMCPLTMTFAAVPALRAHAPTLAARWETRLTSNDPAVVAMAGMAMTERQGGSDVRANITTAIPVGGDVYEIWGHKWFCSYPSADMFLTLAQAPGGLSCFLVERGPGMEFQRLKHKLGTRSLASSEVEFRGIHGTLIGDEGAGVRAIIHMVNHTRLDCVLGSAATMRRGAAEAIHHATHRAAFGAPLVTQPAMRNVLADLTLDAEAATAAALRVARAYDEDDPSFRRLATAILKYWHCKRVVAHAAEAMECFGGNGYVEDSGMPMLFRDAPVNGIWEGTGNVAALDVLRAIINEPEGIERFFDECHQTVGVNATFDASLAHTAAAVRELVRDNGRPVHERLRDAQFTARRTVEELAVLLQASVLLATAPSVIADAFCAARLGDGARRTYGTLPLGTDAAAIIARAAG